jgi:hypothetical protein
MRPMYKSVIKKARPGRDLSLLPFKKTAKRSITQSKGLRSNLLFLLDGPECGFGNVRKMDEKTKGT